VTPRELFESGLCWQMQVWRALGDRMQRAYWQTHKRSNNDSIGLREATKDHIGRVCPNTHASFGADRGCVGYQQYHHHRDDVAHL
jgi:predicted metal-dependent peptidase